MPFFSGFKDTIKQVKYRKPQPFFCPRCKSPDMKVNNTFGILPPKYVCAACGYEGQLVLELEKNEDEK